MKTKNLTLNALMIALLAAASQLSIPVQPVPITLQTLVVMLIGILLTPANAVLTIGGYILLGLIGIPVFSGFSSGPASLLKPAFGYVLSWPAAAWAQSLYLEIQPQVGRRQLIISVLINTVVVYGIGLTYMALILNVYQDQALGLRAILMAGFLPFIPGDLLKMAVAVIIGSKLYPRFRGDKRS